MTVLENVSTRKCRYWKMPVLENANTGKCRYWKCRYWKMPVLENAETGKCRYWKKLVLKMPELKNAGTAVLPMQKNEPYTQMCLCMDKVVTYSLFLSFNLQLLQLC